MLGKLVKERMANWKLTKILIGSVVSYHIILAILYGGFPSYRSYPDEAWIIGTGIYLVSNIPFSQGALLLGASDKPILLPFFVGINYKIFGFPLFLYLLWSWNAITIATLIISAYYIGKYFFDQKTGLFMALLMGFNWHIGWYGQRVLADIAMAAFILLSVSLLGHFIRYKKKTSLLASGFAAALAFWAKEPTTYLLLPFIVFVLIENKHMIRHLHLYLLGFLAGFMPFAAVCFMRYGNPLYPYMVKTGMYGHFLFEPKFNLFVIEWLPFVLSPLACIFLLVGLLVMLKKKKFSFFAWTLYSLAFYLFLIAPAVYDKLLVQFDWILLLAAGVGLAWFTEVCVKKFGGIGILPAVLTLLNTNLYGSPFFYSFEKKTFVMPIFISQRLSWDKYGAISQLIQQVESKQSDWSLAQALYDSPGPNFTLIALLIIALIVISCLILTKRMKNLRRVPRSLQKLKRECTTLAINRNLYAPLDKRLISRKY